MGGEEECREGKAMLARREGVEEVKCGA